MSNTFEHVLAFTSEAEAQADPVVGSWWREGADGEPGSWDASVCIPNIKCWDVREDMTTEVETDGATVPITTHTYLTGWWLCIGLPEVNPALRDHPCLRLLADNHAREIDKAPHTTWCLKAAVPIDDVPYYMVSP